MHTIVKESMTPSYSITLEGLTQEQLLALYELGNWNQKIAAVLVNVYDRKQVISKDVIAEILLQIYYATQEYSTKLEG